MDTSKLKVALINDFLVQDGGAERVFAVFCEMFPKAPIYTIVADFNKAAKRYPKKRVRTSFIQHFPNGKRKHQWYLPFMSAAIESFDFSQYDLVISSSSAFAKGALTQPNTIHISYCHSPTRYLWMDTHSYVRDLSVPSTIKKIIPFYLSKLREWDFNAAQRPDVFIANSQTVKRRIKKYYRRDSQVIYPPIPVNTFKSSDARGDYFLAGGRLVAYKHFDLIVEAFNHLGIPLKIYGTGTLKKLLVKSAKKNISFLGRVSDEELRKLYAHAKGYINPQEEDFGLTMVEALASGCPVIAYNIGGASEIVKEGVNGTFFDEQTWEALADSIIRLREMSFTVSDIIASARKFSETAFKEQMRKIIEDSLK